MEKTRKHLINSNSIRDVFRANSNSSNNNNNNNKKCTIIFMWFVNKKIY